MSRAFSAVVPSGRPGRVDSYGRALQSQADAASASNAQADTMQDSLDRQREQLMRQYGTKALLRGGTAN
jgi:hypothetical protein